MIKFKSLIYLICFTAIISCNAQKSEVKKMDNLNVITLGAGCFWCVEAVFQDLKGVKSVESGYMGGQVKNPTYNAVCSGTTGHAEVARITYDPNVIAFESIIAVFFKTHDPTTLNRQGNDHGTQYRSAIFYSTEEQKESADNIIAQLNKENAYPRPIVTEVSPEVVFYKAENYHQDYFNVNGGNSYCTYVIQPKLDKMKSVFGDLLK